MSGKSIQLLLQEHREAEKILTALDELLESLQQQSAWCACHDAAFARVRAFLVDLWPLHDCREDTILFAALENFLPRDLGPLDVLRQELSQITREACRLVQVGAQLARGDSQPQPLSDFRCAARAFAQLLRDHIYKEDRIFFPMVARRLTSEQDAELFTRMTSCCPPSKIEAE